MQTERLTFTEFLVEMHERKDFRGQLKTLELLVILGMLLACHQAEQVEQQIRLIFSSKGKRKLRILLNQDLNRPGYRGGCLV